MSHCHSRSSAALPAARGLKAGGGLLRLSSNSWELIRIPGNFILNPGNTYTAHLVGCMQLTRFPRNSTNSWEFFSKSRECLPHTPLDCLQLLLIPGIHH